MSNCVKRIDICVMNWMDSKWGYHHVDNDYDRVILTKIFHDKVQNVTNYNMLQTVIIMTLRH